METCKDCLHIDVCEALENGNGIKKVHPIQCGCFKSKADVVEVVRCKDCKCFELMTSNNKYFCNQFGGYVTENDYCSRCRRKDGALE